MAKKGPYLGHDDLNAQRKVKEDVVDFLSLYSRCHGGIFEYVERDELVVLIIGGIL